MTDRNRRRTFVAIVILINAALWAIGGDVVRNIAFDRQTFLGRYSHSQVAWNLVALLASVIVLRIGLARSAGLRRRRVFELLTVVLAIIPVLVLADVILRMREPPTYLLDRVAFRRVPGAKWSVLSADKPEAVRTYPHAQAGYPAIQCRFTIDSNGYRNPGVNARYDIVALGDSFAEGSHVSDEHPWPVRLAARTGLTIYNLGMSSYAPQNYLASLEIVGAQLSPRVVICSLYEGNDFRDTKLVTEHHIRFKQIFNTSPILQRLDHLLVAGLAPIGATWPVPRDEAVAWLPIAYPPGAAARYYAFEPKEVTDLCKDSAAFSASREWQLARDVLLRIRDECRRLHARFILAYVPLKTHVVLPLVENSIPPEGLRAFVALGAKVPLPKGDALVEFITANVDCKETVVRDMCAKEQIEFVSLTAALRAATAAGKQVYFTYDQHWSPEGHDVAAAELARMIGGATGAP